MKYLCVLFFLLSVVLAVHVDELESRPPTIVRTPAAEELPYAIFIDHCDELFALIWTTEPPTWFTPDASFDAEQLIKMQMIYRLEQYQLINICPDHQT